MASNANLGGVVDPRLGDESDYIGTRRDSAIKEAGLTGAAPPAYEGQPGQAPDGHFSQVGLPFEAYHFWAQRAREEEKGFTTDSIVKQIGKIATGKKLAHDNNHQEDPDVAHPVTDDKNRDTSPASEPVDRYGITDTEWERANRATRTATWVTIFYLITTDILGPFNVPWAISRMGYGPGIALYTVFGVTAWYSGVQLWSQFMGLDSPRYPMRNYGDLGYRLFGNWARLGINVLQSCQFFLNVTLLIESNGQGLQQMAAGSSGTGFLCFIVAEVIFMLLGFALGQIRTLQRLGFLANVAVWMNVFVIFMTMGVVPSYGPNEQAAAASYDVTPGQPVMVSGNWPEGSELTDRINGLMNGVFAYGGATLFNELMAEMRRPVDFWKALLIADIFIYVLYITIGLVVYSYQGQYTFNPAYQGIPNSAYAWQTVGNAFSFVTGLIAALLYGNIGIKVLYAAVFRDLFNFPTLDTKSGKWIWVFLVPVYWALAFVVAAAIPQISYLTAFVGAAFILQFTYTFPPLLMVAYNVQKDAMLPEERFDPVTNQVQRMDRGFGRFLRGYMKKPIRNTVDLLYFLGALASAGLGIYASVIGMHTAFTDPDFKPTPFSCNSPTG